MELNENRFGYWSGMPARLKARVFGWIIYWLVVGWMAAQGMLLGFALLAAPFLWWGLKTWVLNEAGAEDLDRGGLIDYTLDYVWNSSVYVRAFVIASCLAALAGGMGWLNPDFYRAPERELTMAEKATVALQSAGDKAKEVAASGKEASSGWIDKAKGWFD